ncbi:MAG: YbjN domain-containing protein [Chitinophagales bacterium]
MFKQILEYFENEGWKYILPEQNQEIAMLGVRTEKGKFHCVLDNDEQDKKFIFFSIYPINVPEKLRSKIAELLLRINFTLYFGSFEMDFSDGEIRFKTSFMYQNCTLTTELIDQIIKNNIATMDTNFELINTFLTEKISMEEAIESLH